MTIKLTTATITVDERTVPLALKHVRQLRAINTSWVDNQLKLIGEVYDHVENVTYTLFDTPDGVQRYPGRLDAVQKQTFGQPQRIVLL